MEAINRLIYAAKQACVDMGETSASLALYETIAPAEEEIKAAEKQVGTLAAERDAKASTIDSMLRCVGKNAANVDDPVAAIKTTYRDLVQTRSERDSLRAQLEEAGISVPADLREKNLI